ncbi:sigma 54-interacting transcriptional regulator [Deltaproteobacteria bacterium OttesenSCG-928-K17]|nr:sigma 54-interacting transcriptional regulator [Deltaproteobacteria bacterium OttesenSCG-928-K17]
MSSSKPGHAPPLNCGGALPLRGKGRPAVKSELAVIAPYRALAGVAAEEARRLGLEVIIEIGNLEDGARTARRLAEEEGVKIFVSRGGTARWIRDAGLPVVEIEVGPCDILEAMQGLRKNKKSVGLIAFENVLAGVHRLSGLVEINLEMAAIAHEAEVPVRLDSFESRVDVVLGDRVVADQAAARGLESRLIQSGPEAVSVALKEAVERLALWRQTTEQHHRHLEILSQFKTVLDAMEDPVLILDREGRARNQNPAALAAWGKEKIDWPANETFRKVISLGRPRGDQVTTLGGRRFLLDFRPIASERDDGAPLVVVMGRSAEKVENSERRLRKAVYLKGHVARFHFGDIITEDQAFKRLLEKSAEYALADSAILIQGESGTGKEMLAQSIHQLKFGGKAPFVALNCASFPASLLESELFGYAPGAFTGALKEGKKGFFELAHGGTLFLDELGEMPLNLQSRLLRVIEEKAVLPLGGDHIIPVNVRLIAATNVDLAEAISQGRFRKDLYFRLGVLMLSMPPLRERGEDALVLLKAMIKEINPGLDLKPLDDRLLRARLLKHSWPGNAREVKNLVERISITTGGFRQRTADLPRLLIEELATAPKMPPAKSEPMDELEALRDFLAPPKRSELARSLGISRTTLWRRQKKLKCPDGETK